MDLKELQDKLDKANATIEALTRANSTNESLIKELDAKVQAYEGIGSPEQINAVYDMFESISASLEGLGTLEQINEAFDLADAVTGSYVSLGTPIEIKKKLDTYQEGIDKNESEKLSMEFGISVDAITKSRANFESWPAFEEHLKGLLTGRKPTGIVDQVVNGTKSEKIKNTISRMAHGL